MSSQFGGLTTKKGWRQIGSELAEEFRKWGIDEYHLPYKADSERLGSVTVTVVISGQERRLTCSRFTDGNWPERNFHAILLAVRSSRLMDQRGIGSLLVEAAQLKALPDPSDPHFVLSVHPSADVETVRAAYRRKIVEAHPDQGGTREGLDRVMEAGRRLGLS